VAFTLDHSICDVVIENPAAADVFEKLDIDYACRGGRVLGDVLSESGISLDAFIGEVDRVACIRTGNPTGPDWRVLPLRMLIRHIIDKHHAYLRFELPALDKWITGISEQHPGERELLLTLQRAIQRFERKLEVQVRKEEVILFPAISDLETATVSGASPAELLFGSVANLSRAMEEENNGVARALHEIRILSNDYTCPPDASNSLKTLLKRLQILAADAHQHLHLENNILFPRAISLEKGGTP
jgi:regulator of cell morphogenesis and NO signaling